MGNIFYRIIDASRSSISTKTISSAPRAAKAKAISPPSYSNLKGREPFLKKEWANGQTLVAPCSYLPQSPFLELPTNSHWVPFPKPPPSPCPFVGRPTESPPGIYAHRYKRTLVHTQTHRAVQTSTDFKSSAFVMWPCRSRHRTTCPVVRLQWACGASKRHRQIKSPG